MSHDPTTSKLRDKTERNVIYFDRLYNYRHVKEKFENCISNFCGILNCGTQETKAPMVLKLYNNIYI
tara:strand:+ start:614 stop:814 length:201 start_codon:yes stop_codon:yes gene_type:complete